MQIHRMAGVIGRQVSLDYAAGGGGGGGECLIPLRMYSRCAKSPGRKGSPSPCEIWRCSRAEKYKVLSG